ncbi:MAG TPA: NADH-quinone oxidoreductase subunit J [Longimicrobiales bacterium]|nr:NADH-quinone oxidoreductase subunit J [Longimicrobiales bacterium]
MTDFPLAQLLWWVFASLAVGGGLGMVTRRNPVASLLFLVLTFFSLAALYVLLGAHFIAAIQIIVYAGAIMVLFLFVIMLLNLGHDYQADLRGGLWIVVGFVAAGTVGWFIWQSFGGPGAVVQRGGAQEIAASVEQLNAVGAIAYPLFRDYIVPFELVGVLLLVAIIGAVLLAKRRV